MSHGRHRLTLALAGQGITDTDAMRPVANPWSYGLPWSYGQSGKYGKCWVPGGYSPGTPPVGVPLLYIHGPHVGVGTKLMVQCTVLSVGFTGTADRQGTDITDSPTGHRGGTGTDHLFGPIRA